MIRSTMERMIAVLSPDGNRTFFETTSFPWVTRVEAGWNAVRAEVGAVLLRRDEIPNFQDISEDQRVLTEGEQWKTFFFYAYGGRRRRIAPDAPRRRAS